MIGRFCFNISLQSGLKLAPARLARCRHEGFIGESIFPASRLTAASTAISGCRYPTRLICGIRDRPGSADGYPVDRVGLRIRRERRPAHVVTRSGPSGCVFVLSMPDSIDALRNESAGAGRHSANLSIPSSSM